MMGERLANEVYLAEHCFCKFHYWSGLDFYGRNLVQVLSVIKHRTGLRKISFVAHSLGGLVARYAIGKLYQQPAQANSLDSSATGGEIAGLEPMNFITFATPHLGSRGHRQVN